MANLKGAKIMVAAPNAATNKLLTSSAMRSALRTQAQAIQSKIAPKVGHKDPRRYPVIRDNGVGMTSRGTVRSSAVVKGKQYALYKSVVMEVLGNKVDWK